ncbi:MAG: hypothetical protein ABI068_07760 [Ktedonobacterales bacterium]
MSARAYNGVTPSARTGAGAIGLRLWRSLTHVLARLSREEWMFAGLLLLCYAFFLAPEGTNTISRYDMVYALSHGTAIIDQHANNTIDVSFYGGHWYSPRSLGLSLLATPVLFLLGLVFNIDNTQLFTLTEQIAILNLLTVAPVAIICALTLRRFIMRLRPELAPTSLPMVVAGAFALGTLAFPFSTTFFSHAFGGALAFIGFYLLYRAQDYARPELRVFAAGILVGCAVLSEYPLGLVMLALFGYICLIFPGQRLRMLAIFGLGILPSGLLLGWYDWFAFGNPFALSYGYVADSEFSGQHSGFFGITWPHLDALTGILAWPRGLLAESPLLILVPLGFYRWFKAHKGRKARTAPNQPVHQSAQQLRVAMRDGWWSAWTTRLAWLDRVISRISPEALLCLTICVIYPLAVASYFLPMAGENLPGPRLLIPMLPYACLTLAWVVDDVRRWLRTFFAAALCFGVLLSYIYVLSGVRMFHTYGPYPVTDLYWPLLTTGYVPSINGATPPNLATLWFMAPQWLSVYIVLIPLLIWLYFAVRAVMRGVAPSGGSTPPDSDSSITDEASIATAASAPTSNHAQATQATQVARDGEPANNVQDALVGSRQ